MSYPFDKYEFDDITEYIAAKRDKAKIDALEKKGKSKAQIAKNMKEQIAREGISFETVVGEDFLKQLDKDSFTREEESELEINERRLKRREAKRKREKRARNLLLIPFYMILVLAVGIGILWSVKEEQSRKSMEELRERAAAPVTPTAVPTVSASELYVAKEPAPAEDSNTRPEPTEEEIPTQILPRFKELYEENNDLAGWLTIEGTVIDYPVMYKEDDNDYYLSHNFNKDSDVNGMLVLDKRCARDGSGRNMLIHGHHMRNGSMFGSLQKYEDEAYFKEHPLISFSTLYQERSYEIFAVFKSSVYDEETDDIKFYDFIDIQTREDFNSYIRSAINGSLYDTGVRPYWGDKLLSLSTCEYSKENGRLVVVGREVK